MNRTYNYTVETYAMFFSFDESVLLLNPSIEKYGYKFVLIGLVELEDKFGDLFNMPTQYESTSRMIVEGDETISGEFANAIQNNPYFGIGLLIVKKLVLLKRIEDVENSVVEGGTDYADPILALNDMQKFTDNLILNLRLFKNGRIETALMFQTEISTGKIVIRHTPSFAWGPSRISYSFSEEDARNFEKAYRPKIKVNELTELALNNFNLSYRAGDGKTMFITLMTCLESIFNQGHDQISHTVSRHYAVMVSHTMKDFRENYVKTKHLYGIRSKIVHGSEIKENLASLIDDLRNRVRNAINHCLACSLTKKQLFDYLNERGF